MLLGTGIALSLVVTVWGVIVASEHIQEPSAPAIDAYVRGQDTQQRSQEMVRAIEGTQELEEQDPRLAAKTRSYRADLQRIQTELSE